MSDQNDDNYIVFDNLVQADSQIVGANQPVKAVKVSGGDEPYAQINAEGELYRPSNLDDVADRANSAGDQFINRFKLK